MNNFTLVLTSSVLAASLTSFVNWWLQRNNFRDDYYKKVIDKRMTTYDQISKAMGRLQIVDVSASNNKYHAIFNQEKDYSDFVVQLAFASLEGIWISSQCSLKITQLNEFMHRTFNATWESEWIHQEIVELAESNYDDICKHRESIRDQILKDLISLHHVEQFLKLKN